MNLLSCCSLTTAVLFVVLIGKRLTGSHMDRLNLWSILVCSFLGWWAFCDAFFYSAKTLEAAWRWHHLSAIGWCGFIPVTAYYFFIMTGTDQKLSTVLRKGFFWLPALCIMLYSVFGETTPMAQDLVQSSSGLGWTYVQRYSTPWPFLFLAILFLYFGIAFWLLKYRNSPHAMIDSGELANGFILLDTVAIVLGFISLFVIPYVTDFLPPLGFLATLLFLIGYRFQLWDLDLLHIELALNPGSIFDSCMDAMLILNKELYILYANDEACRIFDSSTLPQTSLRSYLTADSMKQLENYAASNEKKRNLDLELTSNVPVICSINRGETRRRSHSVFILSLHDIGQLRLAQQRLEYLAHYDELTGLPNRRLLGEILEQWSDRYTSNQQDFVLLFLDLDNFKYINDHFGHHAGDIALQTVARKLQSQQNGSDVAARLAGDEFIFLHYLKNQGETADTVLRIREAIHNIDCSSFAPGFELNAAIGACRFSEAKEVRILFKLADERMYQVKKGR